MCQISWIVSNVVGGGKVRLTPLECSCNYFLLKAAMVNLYYALIYTPLRSMEQLHGGLYLGTFETIFQPRTFNSTKKTKKQYVYD